ncbi:MAG: ytxJ [Bacillales bacterium]|jgi:bacillithiol system protein YtxJ|nr:ytxJ [Bacillales bacterium]
MHKITTEDELNKIIFDHDKFIFLKHSSTCPVSTAGYEATKAFAEASDIPVFYLIVQESRPLSNYIAEEYEIKHESPQVFYFVEGEVVWTASHYGITKEEIDNIVK